MKLSYLSFVLSLIYRAKKVRSDESQQWRYDGENNAGSNVQREVLTLLSDNWNISGWEDFQDDDECLWPGITCDYQSNSVSELVLTTVDSSYYPFITQVAEIPTEIGLLSDLKRLVICGKLRDCNYFSESDYVYWGDFFEGTPIPGPIPSEIGLLSKLSKLTLIMDDVYDVPSEIGNMKQLEQLNLRLDGFVGTFPSEISQLGNLRTLNLNSLESLPSEIGLLTNLERFTFRSMLDYNANLPQPQSIPSEFGKLSKVQLLLLESNAVSSMPSEFGLASSLRTLDLRLGKFDGGFPEEFGLLKNLEYLRMEDFDSFPREIGLATSLEYLEFDRSWKKANATDRGELSIPSEIGLLSNLKSFRTTGSVNGKIPSELGKLKNLCSLYLLGDASFNESTLTGSLPSQIGCLRRLRVLDLDNNDLTGTIPNEMGKMFRLSTVSMDQNDFSGDLCPFWHVPFLYTSGNDKLGGPCKDLICLKNTVRFLVFFPICFLVYFQDVWGIYTDGYCISIRDSLC